MKLIVRRGFGLVLAGGVSLTLAACGAGRDGDPLPLSNGTPTASSRLVNDGPPMLGAPYKIGGKNYVPADVADYDDVGYAGRYDPAHAGQPTANGESYDPARISAAHKTLPLPSYVEVTALDTGRTILVRVNDRGPMVNDRLIDLSDAAAQQLGLQPGATAVRVRRTNPPVGERAQLRSGQPVPERIATPNSLLSILRDKAKALPKPANVAPARPAPTATTPIASSKAKPGNDGFIVEDGSARSGQGAVPRPAAGGGYFVQVAAFSTEARAQATARAVGGQVSRAGRLWRVRMGPFQSQADAGGALSSAKAQGFRDAVVVRDR